MYWPAGLHYYAHDFRQARGCAARPHGAGIEVILDVVYNHTAEGAPPAGAAACPAGRQAEG